MAYGAIHAIEEYGMRVPDDVSVVGFNDIDLPIAGKLKLTTVRVDIDLMGKSAVEYLQKVVENNDGTSLKIVVPTSLIIGDSVRAVEAT
jgi:LacI family transcriptional regulator